MAKARNCQICGKIFVPLNKEKICRSCREEQEELEHKVIDYVRDNPKSKIQEIVDETGATEAMIRRMMDAGYFEQVGVNIPHPCKKCGKTIIIGQYCENCMAQMQANLQSVQDKIQEASDAAAAAYRGRGMHSRI